MIAKIAVRLCSLQNATARLQSLPWGVYRNLSRQRLGAASVPSMSAAPAAVLSLPVSPRSTVRGRSEYSKLDVLTLPIARNSSFLRWWPTLEHLNT